MGAAVVGNAESFPWAVLEAIALNYERQEYRYSAPHQNKLRHWSSDQWLLAEMLWQSWDQPPGIGLGGDWLGRVMEGWGFLVPAIENSSVLDSGNTVLGLVEKRATLSQWQRWLQQFDSISTRTISGVVSGATSGVIPATETGETPLLSDRDFWTIVGILTRTGGDISTAIAQGKMLLDPDSNTSVLGWIGAVVGLTYGAEWLLTNGGQQFSPRSNLGTDKIYDGSQSHPWPPFLDKARSRAINCFTRWSGASSFNPSSLTPWTVNVFR